MMNQIRFKTQANNDFERLVIAKVASRVRIRTYVIRHQYRRNSLGYALLIFEGIEPMHIVGRGFTWDLNEAKAWLEERTGGLSID